MHHRAMTALALILIMTVAGCGKNNPTSPENNPSGGGLSFALDAEENIASGKVTITKGTVAQSLPVTLNNHVGSVAFQDVQVGNWTIQVQMFDAGGVEIYSGSGNALVKKNETTTVRIRLQHNTGRLEIIVENPQTGLSNKIIYRDGFSGGTVMNADGSGSYHLINDPYISCATNYRGGSVLMFSGNHPEGPHQGIWQCHMDGSNLRRLDLPPLRYPRWSWSGHKIACHTVPDISGSLVVMDPDGSNRVTLTTGHTPVWLPDNRIVYATADSIRVMNSDGSNQQIILSGLSEVYTWDCSADGRILYSTSAGQIRMVNLDGSGDCCLAGGQHDYAGVFNEDGTQIVYQAGTKIWIMNADGTGKTQLTFDGSIDENPRFLF